MRNCLRAIPFFYMHESIGKLVSHSLYNNINFIYFSDFLLLLYGGKVDKKYLTRIKQL